MKNSFSLYEHGLYKNSIPIQRLLFHFFKIHSWFIQKFLYIPSLFTHKNFLFAHYLHTHKIFPYIFTYKNSFLFFSYRHDIFSQRLFFYSWRYHDFFVHFIFRTTFLNENSTRFRNFNKHYRQ